MSKEETLTKPEIEMLIRLLDKDSQVAIGHGKSNKDHSLSEAAMWLAYNNRVRGKLVAAYQKAPNDLVGG